jgi:hypothetical protein
VQGFPDRWCWGSHRRDPASPASDIFAQPAHRFEWRERFQGIIRS